MSEKSGYVGRISHNGTQVVKAPVADTGKKPSGKVKEGNDLRNVKGK